MGRKYEGVDSRSSKSIEIYFIYKGEKCRETLRLEPTPGNLRKAFMFRMEIIQAIERGEFDYINTFPNSKRGERLAKIPDPNDRSVRTLLREWLERRSKTLKKSTLRGYREIIEQQLIPNLGHYHLKELRRKHVRDWVSSLEASNKRIANLISPLRAALQEAVQDDLLDRNPLEGWRYRKQEPPKPSTVDPFTPEEQVAILDELEGQGRNLIQFAFWTGLRTSELIALNWSDIDFVRETISVNKAVTKDSVEPESTKTRAGTREVALLKPAADALRNQWVYTGEAADRIFHNPKTNQPWSGDRQIRRGLWSPALKRAGVRYRYPYQTRHTYASMMLSAGEPLAWVSHQMGHSTVLMTTQAYARWVPRESFIAGNKAEAMFYMPLMTLNGEKE